MDIPEIFLFRVFTEHGRFHVTTDAESKEQAEQLVSQLFQRLGIEVEQIVFAQRATGEPEESLILSGAGQHLNAGRKLWRALGVDSLYEATMIAEKERPQ